MPTQFSVQSSGPVTCMVTSKPHALPKAGSVCFFQSSGSGSLGSLALRSSTPTPSRNPTAGMKLVLKLVSTTPEGRMNSSVPPPLRVQPDGKTPSNEKPIVAVSPVASGLAGVNTHRPARSSTVGGASSASFFIGSMGLPSSVHFTLRQCAPCVSGICSIGVACGLRTT